MSRGRARPSASSGRRRMRARARWLRGALALQPVPGPEDPCDNSEKKEEETERHHEAPAYRHVGAAVEAPAKAADEIHDRVKQAEAAPGLRQHVDGVERAAEKGERR